MGKTQDPEKGSDTTHRDQTSAAGLREVLHADEKTPPELRNEPPSRVIRKKSAAPLLMAIVLGTAGMILVVIGMNVDNFAPPFILGLVLWAAALVAGAISQRD